MIRSRDKLLLKVEADCGYHELGAFVSQLESSQKFLSLNKLSIRHPKQGANLKVSMVIGMAAGK